MKKKHICAFYYAVNFKFECCDFDRSQNVPILQQIVYRLHNLEDQNNF